MTPANGTRRTLLRGAVVIASILTVGKGVPAWRTVLGTMRRETWMQREELERTRRLLHETGPDSARLDRARRRLADRLDSVVRAPTFAAASARIAALIDEAGEDVGVDVGAIQGQPDSGVFSGLRGVNVSGDVTGDLRGVLSLLARLEESPMLLAVRELSIQQPDVAGTSGPGEVLHVHFVVEGLVWLDPTMVTP